MLLESSSSRAVSVPVACGVSVLAAVSLWVLGCNDPQAPVALGSIPGLTVEVGSTKRVHLAGYFSDADGDTLSYAAVSSHSRVQVSVSRAYLEVRAVASGSATVTVTATDLDGLRAEQTFTVTVPNRAPEAVGQMPDVEVFVGDSVDIALAEHFSDPDGDVLTYAATSADESVATVSVAGATLRAAGVRQGATTVTVTALDAGGLRATQTFTATVPNRAPEAVGEMPDADVFVVDSNEITLAEYFSDPDGDTLAYAATSDDEGVATVSVTEATLQVAGVALGTATVTVTATDSGGLSAEQELSVIVRKRTAYLVQAVQSRGDPVSAVAGKEALLRVFATATRTTTETLPPAKATFYVDSSETYSLEIDGTSEPIPTDIDEGSLEKSLNVTIPGSAIEEGLSVVIEIDPDSTIDADILVARRIPESGELDILVEDVPDFELTAIPFLYTDDPDSSVIETLAEMADDEEDHELLHDTYDLLPIEEMTVDDHDPVEIDSRSGYDVLSRTVAIRAAEEGSGYWMGLMPWFSDVGGVAYVPGTSSASVPSAYVMAHELGHNLSLWHAPCGGAPGSDPAYPYEDGSVGAWGYDHRGDSLIDKDRAYDLMGYCWSWWVSDYHFEKAFEHRTAQEMSHREARGRTGPSLLVWGSRSPSGELSMDPALLVEGRSLLPEAGGDHTLTGLGEARRELFSISFDMDEPADAEEGTGIFVFLLPVEPGWDALASLVLAGPGDAVFTLNGDTEATMALVRDARSGQVRAIRGDFAERPPAPPGHVVRWSRGVPDSQEWSVMTGRKAGTGP